MRSSNPVFSDKIFAQERAHAHEASKVMTVDGTIHKTGFLLCLLLVGASWSWSQVSNGSGGEILPIVYGAALLGFVFAIIGCFARRWLIVIAPIYAVCQGVALGGISALFEAQMQHITMQAAGLTFATLFGMLFLYRTGIIKVTAKFRAVVLTATAGIFVLYFLSFILGMLGVNMPYIHSMENPAMSIGISVVIVIVAALNLMLDFDFIDRGARMGLPKHMEWYGAFGLLVTLIWLYLELLRLLAKIRSR